MLLGFCASLVVSSLISIQANAPTTAPTTDPSTPKGALRAFAKAARAGDVDMMKKLVHGGDADQAQLLTVACDYQKNMVGFLSAVKAKFGEASVRKLAGMRLSPFDDFLRTIENDLDRCKEDIKEDKARILDPEHPEDDDKIILTREGNEWRISLPGMTAKWTHEQFVERLQQMQQAGAGLESFADDVKNGQFETFDSMVVAMKRAFGR